MWVCRKWGWSFEAGYSHDLLLLSQHFQIEYMLGLFVLFHEIEVKWEWLPTSGQCNVSWWKNWVSFPAFSAHRRQMPIAHGVPPPATCDALCLHGKNKWCGFTMVTRFTAVLELPSSRGASFGDFCGIFPKSFSLSNPGLSLRGLPFSEPPTVNFSTQWAKLKFWVVTPSLKIQ